MISYDQLQLLQILDFFHGEAGTSPVHLVQADDYLGLQKPETLLSFRALRAPVTGDQKALAARIFQSFRKSTPVELAEHLENDLSTLPHMKAALKRLFEDLPDSQNGLSRTQHQILTVIERDASPPKHVFGTVQAMEEAKFMGDVICWHCLEEMAFNTSPLVEGLPGHFCMMESNQARRDYLGASLTLTDSGRAVLAGEADHAEINSIDRWLGGTHITTDTIWRWDRDASSLVSPT